MDRRHLAAAVVAAVFTVASAGAAVALNVDAGDGDSPTGHVAGRPGTAPPSTLYVDVTVPDLAPGSRPRIDQGGDDPPAATGGASTVPGRPHAEGRDDDD